MGKTIKSLQSKAWYRLLKVSHIVFWISLFVITLFSIFYELYENDKILNVEKSRLHCWEELDVSYPLKEFLIRQDISIGWSKEYSDYSSITYELIREKCKSSGFTSIILMDKQVFEFSIKQINDDESDSDYSDKFNANLKEEKLKETGYISQTDFEARIDNNRLSKGLSPEQFEQLKQSMKTGGAPQSEFISSIQRAKKIANEIRTRQEEQRNIIRTTIGERNEDNSPIIVGNFEKVPENWGLISLYMGTTSLLLLLVEWLVRHAFYYVVIGKFFPPKK